MLEQQPNQIDETLLVFLASEAARGITGQCIGIGGDKLSLWSHPQEIRIAYRDGGWTADVIAELWDHSVGQQLETYGTVMPKAKLLFCPCPVLPDQRHCFPHLANTNEP